MIRSDHITLKNETPFYVHCVIPKAAEKEKQQMFNMSVTVFD